MDSAAIRGHAGDEGFADLFCQMAQGVVYLDATGAITLANPAAERILGVTLQELQGREPGDPRWDAVHADGSPFPFDEHPSMVALRTGQPVLNVVLGLFNPKEPQRRWLRLNAVPQFRPGEAQPYRVLTTFDDITELKEMERAIRQSEELFEAVVEGTTDAVFVKDLQGRYLFVNAAAAEALGQPADRIIGRTNYDFVPAALADALKRHDEETVRAGRAIVYEDEGPGPGSPRKYTITKSPLRSATGEIAGVIGIGRNITEMKRLEEEYRQSQKMEAIGRLAGGIAHDFNNLLTVILGYVEDVQREAVPSVRIPADEIRRSAERAAELTTQLLAFSRRQVLQPRPTDLNHLITNLERMLRRIIGEDIALHSILRPGTGTIQVDPNQFEQVLLNLAVNARDAMPGGGRLTIEAANMDLDGGALLLHPALPAGPYVMISVTDTGVGMDRETLSRVFEPFFTTKAGSGTGLGLATVHGIVKQSGGDIWAYSEIGHGTTFKIVLPRVDAAPIEIAANRVVERGGSETILIVDDEDQLRHLMQTVLSKRGYDVTSCAGAREAAAWLQDHRGRLDLVITDLVMPDGSGLQVAEAARATHPEARLLFMSGYAEHAALDLVRMSGEANFIQKPFTPGSLAAKVRQVIDSGRAPSKPVTT